MSNHFHMLVAVEDLESEEVQAMLVADDGAFLARLKPLYAADALDGIGMMLKVIRGRAGDTAECGGMEGGDGDQDVVCRR